MLKQKPPKNVLSKNLTVILQKKIFSQDFLDKQRQVCDQWADVYALQIVTACEQVDIRSLLAWLNSTQKTYPKHLDGILEKYFSEVAMPPWADTTRLKRASNFFFKHKNLILYLLGVLSLPYCYAARKGVQVLFLSQRLQKDTLNRLKETALFVIQANSYSLYEEVTWKVYILKIRLLHALMRIFTRRSGKWQNEWGEPINQEDMAGTNLSFSYIVLRGMRKLGFAYTHQEADDFLHLWNVIGYLLGVDERLLPNTMQEAFWLDKQISDKEFAESREGQILVQSLIDVFSLQSPSSALVTNFAIAQMRYLLGDKVAEILHIPNQNAFKVIPILTLSEMTARWLIPKSDLEREIIQNV